MFRCHRYETIPDPHSDANLPVVTVTNFTESQGSKEVILVTAGEHARELITSEIVYWVGALLSGQGEELADWAALQPVQAAAWKTGATKTTLHEWAGRLLQHVVFKVSFSWLPSSAHELQQRPEREFD